MENLSTTLYNKFVQYGKARVQPGLLYFQSKFSNELSNSLAAFKAVRLFVPSKIQEMKTDVAHINLLKSFTFLSDRHQPIMCFSAHYAMLQWS